MHYLFFSVFVRISIRHNVVCVHFQLPERKNASILGFKPGGLLLKRFNKYFLRAVACCLWINRISNTIKEMFFSVILHIPSFKIKAGSDVISTLFHIIFTENKNAPGFGFTY